MAGVMGLNIADYDTSACPPAMTAPATRNEGSARQNPCCKPRLSTA
jgi:hypothetical protein